MESSPVLLAPADGDDAHPIAGTSHYAPDVALLAYLLQDLRVLIRRYAKGEISVEPHQVFTWDVFDLERRIVLCNPEAVVDTADVEIVGFFGDRRQDAGDRLEASEGDLLAEFVNFPGILSYSSIELVDHYWANLVVHRQSSDREAWREGEAHKRAVDMIAPIAYHGVRIHNGHIPGGVAGSGSVRVDSTKYWDYDVTPTWHAVRDLGDAGWTSR